MKNITYKSGFPNFFSDFACVLDVVRDENIIEDGSCLDLPEVESDCADFVSFVDFRIGLIFRVVDFRMYPWSLVVGVVNLLWFPLALQYTTSVSFKTPEYSNAQCLLFIF